MKMEKRSALIGLLFLSCLATSALAVPSLVIAWGSPAYVDDTNDFPSPAHRIGFFEEGITSANTYSFVIWMTTTHGKVISTSASVFNVAAIRIPDPYAWDVVYDSKWLYFPWDSPSPIVSILTVNIGLSAALLADGSFYMLYSTPSNMLDPYYSENAPSESVRATKFDTMTLDIPTPNLRFIHAHTEALITALTTEDGRLYLVTYITTGCTTGNGNFTSVATNATHPMHHRVLLPRFTGIPKLSFNTQRAIAIVDNQIWAWGSSTNNYLGQGSAAQCVYTPFLVPFNYTELDIDEADVTWTHVVTMSDGLTMVIALDGSVITMGGLNADPTIVHPILTSFVRSGPTGQSDFIASVVDTYNTISFLTSLGEVWAWIPRTSREVTYALADVPKGVPGPWKADLGLTVPPNYRIKRLVGDAQSPGPILAIAEPINPLNATVVPLPTQPAPDSTGLLVWDSLSFARTPTALSANKESTYMIDMRYQPEHNKFSRVIVADGDILAMTQIGSVLIAGGSDYIAPFEGKGTNFPQPLDQRLFHNLSVIDIAKGYYDSFVLLSNGSLASWGMRTSQYLNSLTPPFDPEASADRKRVDEFVAPDSIDYSPVDHIIHNEGETGAVFTRIFGKDGFFAALDNSGKLYVWGVPWANNTYLDRPVLLNIHEEYGPVAEFAFGEGLFYAIVQNGVLNEKLLIRGYPRSSSFAGDAEDELATYILVNTTESLLDLKLVKQIESVGSICLFRTNTAVWGIGQHDLWFGNTTYYHYPQLVQIANMPSGIRKIALTNGLYVVTNDNRLYASCDTDYLALCSGKAEMRRILHQYEVLDVCEQRFASGNPTFRCAIVNTSSIVSPARDYDASAYLNLVFGSTSKSYWLESDPIPNTNEMIRILPFGHPLESATATNFSIGAWASVSDGMMQGEEENVTVPRILRWGTISAVGDGPSLTAPSYLPMSRLGAAPNFHSVNGFFLTHLVHYTNCSMTALVAQSVLSNNDAPTTFLPRRGVNNDDAYASQYPNLQSIEIDHYHAHYIFNESVCQIENNPIVDIQCSSFGGMAYSSTGITAWNCLHRSSNGSIFVRGAWGYNFMDSCASGLYASPEDCATAVEDGYTGNGYYSVFFKLNVSQGNILESRSVTSMSIGFFHAIVITSDGVVATWGLNNRAQQAMIPHVQLNSTHIPHPVTTLPITSGEVYHSVLAARHTSYVISARTIVAWGDNYWGQLGRGETSSSTPFSSVPKLVLLPFRIIQDFQCSATACFVLYPSGEIFSWGASSSLSLARPATDPHLNYDPTPRAATLLNFPGPSRRKITQLLTSTAANVVVVRAVRDFSTPSVEPVCVGAQPGPNFYCIEGVWTLIGDVVVGDPETPTFVVTGPIKVIGNFTVLPGTTVVFKPSPTFGNDASPLVNVSGCFVIEGNVEFEIDPTTWVSLKTKLNGRQILLVESSCSMLNAAIVYTVKTPKDCRKTTATTESVDRGSGRFGLQTIFKVNGSACNRWWIILVSVLGGVLLLVGIIMIIYKVMEKRTKIQPRVRTI
jgi:hypothetical protein